MGHLQIFILRLLKSKVRRARNLQVYFALQAFKIAHLANKQLKNVVNAQIAKSNDHTTAAWMLPESFHRYLLGNKPGFYRVESLL